MRARMLATRYPLLLQVGLLQLQRFDLNQDVLAIGRGARGAVDLDNMIGVFLDLFRLEQLRNIEKGVTFSRLVVEGPVVRPTRRERAAGGDESPLKRAGQ